MKIQCISDTHNQHKSLKLQDSDLIIHSGDFSIGGTKTEVLDFLHWYSELKIKHKILIPGNHDIFVEREGSNYVKDFCKNNNIHLLIDDTIELEGIKIFGSPYTPRFGYGWAFNRDRTIDKALSRSQRGVLDAGFIGDHWKKIPHDVNIIISHGPCHNILDKRSFGTNIGCKELLKKVKEIKPKYFICGHVHENRGIIKIDKTTFINASSCDRKYNVQDPFLFNY